MIGAGVLLSLANCATQAPAPSALCQLRDDNGNAIPALFSGTLAPSHRGHAATHVVLLQTVETACCNGLDRIVFGSHAPLFYFDSSLLKMRESELAGFQIRAISAANAQGLQQYVEAKLST